MRAIPSDNGLDESDGWPALVWKGHFADIVGKGMLGKNQALQFIKPQAQGSRRVLVVLSAESWGSSIEIQFEQLNLGRVKWEGEK